MMTNLMWCSYSRWGVLGSAGFSCNTIMLARTQREQNVQNIPEFGTAEVTSGKGTNVLQLVARHLPTCSYSAAQGIISTATDFLVLPACRRTTGPCLIRRPWLESSTGQLSTRPIHIWTA